MGSACLRNNLVIFSISFFFSILFPMMMKIYRLTKFFSEDFMLNIIESLCAILIGVMLAVTEIKTFFLFMYIFLGLYFDQ